MNISLLKEREAFKKKAFANPVVENKRKKGEKERNEAGPKKKARPSGSASREPKSSNKDLLNYKTMQSASQCNFNVLRKIVDHMKQRHKLGDTYPLTVDEILDETEQLDVQQDQKQKEKLVKALQENPKIRITPDGKYAFKPPFPIKDKKGLMKLLERYDSNGMGGIMMEDIQESLPNADKAIKNLGDNISFIKRPIDKKEVLFYNDKKFQYSVDEEFQKLWRSVAVDGIDEMKIEEYLEKQGITSMQDMGIKKVTPIQKRKKGGQRKGKNFKRLNDHMGDILQDYSDK